MIKRSLRMPFVVVAIGAVALLPAATAGHAATPTSGTLSTANPTVTYTAGPFFVPNVDNLDGSPHCGTGEECDTFALTVDVPAGTDTSNNVSVQIGWPNSVADFDLYVEDASGAIISQSASSSDPEVALIPAIAGQYTVLVVPYDPLGQSFTGTISLAPKTAGNAQTSGTAPRYANYPAPNGLGTGAGEPSIGADWKSGASMYEAGLQTLRVTWDDSVSPAGATWKDVSSPTTSKESLDPILFTDHNTNRTFVSQLTGQDSLSAFSDDDGASWTPSQGGGIPSGVDHQTFGGGPYASGTLAGPLTSYKDAVYYCSQSIAAAFCARSDNGGLTFGAGVPIYTLTQCGGLHGHVKVAPDGSVYVPNKGCSGHQGVVVSTDNGLTWAVRTVPSSTDGTSDPSVGIGSGGTVYFGYGNGDGHAHIAVSHDHGQTWQYDTDVGLPFGIQNTAFPAVVAGDDNRAAFAFLGSTSAGNLQDSAFPGVWHLYIASTFDGGQSWTTVDATPNDPVQRGCIWLSGGSNPCRNLLDFMDATVDAQGRVLVGYADGCIGGCVQNPPNSYSALATIARQTGGQRMFAQYDPVQPSVPGRPSVTATRTSSSSAVTLTWQAPDSGGSPITGYNIYRGASPGGEKLYARYKTTKTTFTDTKARAGQTYYYQVSAINAIGEGPLSPEVTPQIIQQQSACIMPGMTVATDPAGDQAGAPLNSDLDITEVDVGQNFSNGKDNLVFTMQVADLSTLVPNHQWKILWTYNAQRYYVGMSTDATGKPSFDYGTISGAAPDTSNPPGNVPTSLGPADAGSGYSAGGTITIVVSTDKVGNPQPGQTLGGDIQGRTYDGQGNVTVTQSTATDFTSSGTYTLIGSCP